MVVAINNYPTAPLRGCVADGQAMVDFVKEKLHVPASQIVTLFDEAASREAILSTFRKHFTDNEAIAKGDGIIFGRDGEKLEGKVLDRCFCFTINEKVGVDDSVIDGCKVIGYTEEVKIRENRENGG